MTLVKSFVASQDFSFHLPVTGLAVPAEEPPHYDDAPTLSSSGDGVFTMRLSVNLQSCIAILM